MTDISLCVFLGNPGREYVHSRHNAGFMLAGLHRSTRNASWQEKFHGQYAEVLDGGRKIHLLKPQTFMNKSGISVAAAASFFKVDVRGDLVVHDELELPFGTVGYRLGGGLGGHNGLRSVAERLGSKDFARLRIGIGRPRGGSVSSYVLSQFNSDEKAVLERVLHAAADMF
ncbi:MAG: aminoacyl-tRNA hydrolase, partial [Spirochaetia bacterium]